MEIRKQNFIDSSLEFVLSIIVVHFQSPLSFIHPMEEVYYSLRIIVPIISHKNHQFEVSRTKRTLNNQSQTETIFKEVNK
jgi:hypothetical protein